MKISLNYKTLWIQSFYDFLDHFRTSHNLEFKCKQKYSKFFDTFEVCQTHIDRFKTFINKIIHLSPLIWVFGFLSRSKSTTYRLFNKLFFSCFELEIRGPEYLINKHST